jgi:NifU-like protein involved in Fe-S cluster formation
MHKKLTKSEVELLEKSGYPEKAISYYVNMTDFGHMSGPDVSLAYTGPCGDSIMFYLKTKGKSLIEDVKFQYLGYPGADSSGAALRVG